MDISASVMVPISAGIDDELESSTGEEHIARSCKIGVVWLLFLFVGFVVIRPSQSIMVISSTVS